MKSKKIAILYAGAAFWGGVETYLEQLFLNFDSNLASLELVSLGNWPLSEKLKNNGFPVTVVSIKWFQIFKTIGLAKLVKENGYSLLTSQGMVANFYGRMASLFSGTPNLVTIHSDYKFDYPGPKKYLYLLSFLLLSFVTKKYITVSEFLKRETRKLWVRGSKIKVIYNGVQDVGIRLHSRGPRPVFGSLGRLHYKKGYMGLVQAVALLTDLNLEVRIWGDGEEKENLEKEIEALSIKEKVKLMGFTNDISKALSEIDYYIQPSLEEGFGITVAEAMYAEKPIIVTPAGSLPELIENNKTGIITADFAPEAIARAMRELILKKDTALLAKEARETAVSRFGIDKWIAEIEKTYLEAAK